MKNRKNQIFPRYLIILLSIIFVSVILAQTSAGLEINPKNRTIDISVIKRVTQQYYLLTKDSPIELNIAGPNWLRVYTRILYKPGMEDKAIYKIIVEENDEEKIVSLETEKSNSAIGPAKQEFGKWRSFFIEIPKGGSSYKFSLWQAASETVAVRFSFEKPKEWLPQPVAGSSFKLVLEESGKIVDYYNLIQEEPIKVKFEGPLRLKIAARLNYDITMDGAQKFTILALENGKELQRATFRVIKSESAIYKNKTEVIPSVERTFYLPIPEGKHQLEFQLNETIAKNASLQFLIKTREKYE